MPLYVPTPDEWIDSLPHHMRIWAVLRLHVDCHCNDVVNLCATRAMAEELCRKYMKVKQETHAYLVEAMPLLMEK